MKSAPNQADLRVRRTHKLLWEALLAELAERPFEDITVKDLCARAMVHRTTFYTHYVDKYALLEQGMRELVAAWAGDEPHRPPNAHTADQPPAYFIRLFEQAAEHQQFYRLMLCGDGVGRFQKQLKTYIADLATAKAREVSQANAPLAVPVAMHAQFVAGAAVSLLAWWLENDMPLSPHQMAQYLLAPHGASVSAPSTR